VLRRRQLLLQTAANPNAVNDAGHTPAHLAKGRRVLVQLFQAGANFKLKVCAFPVPALAPARALCTCLCSCSFSCTPARVRSCGLNVSISSRSAWMWMQDTSGRTPLFSACATNRVDCAIFLCEVDDLGETLGT
jgi:hypothetical protein